MHVSCLYIQLANCNKMCVIKKIFLFILLIKAIRRKIPNDENYIYFRQTLFSIPLEEIIYPAHANCLFPLIV